MLLIVCVVVTDLTKPTKVAEPMDVWGCMQIAACMVASDSVALRKLALEFASAQLTSQPHMAALYKVAVHLVKAGKCHSKFWSLAQSRMRTSAECVLACELLSSETDSQRLFGLPLPLPLPLSPWHFP